MNDEFQERIRQISATIDQLRATTGKDRRVLLDTLFRTVHSLKAAAHANGLNDLAARAHEFEDLLHAVRTGRASLDELTDFKSPQNILTQDTQTQNIQIEDAIPAEIRSSLKDEERHRLAECLAERASLYLVETCFEVASFDRQFQQLKEELNKTGEVIATAPKTEDGKINFRILYATNSDLYRILDQAMRAGRSVAAAKRKQVDFSIRVDASLDKPICDVLADPLMHLVRNAVDHGIETTGKVSIGATTVQGVTRITVTDNGRGIDPDTIERMFEPGFSTAPAVTEISGRGVGLDVVKMAVEQLDGTIYISSEPGKGSTFEIILRQG
jgi:two-component system chemotaxis sensor kinase CheA